MIHDLDANEYAVYERAIDIKELWLNKPVDNSPEWHDAVLRLIQALDGAIITTVEINPDKTLSIKR